jgi:hypothetical protein
LGVGTLICGFGDDDDDDVLRLAARYGIFPNRDPLSGIGQCFGYELMSA